MKLTPLDILRKQFPMKRKGFDKEAVDSFLVLVREQIEELSRENTLLKEECSGKEKELARYRGTEQTLRNTLMVAQQMIKNYKNDALKEIECSKREAELQARRTISDAQNKVIMMQGDMKVLKRLRKHFQTEMRHLIENHLKMLDDHNKGELFSDLNLDGDSLADRKSVLPAP